MTLRARRFQLRKEPVGIVRHGHPWVFRDQLSSAAGVFADGERLRLFDGANKHVGYGIYAAEGAIAIRVLRTGDGPIDALWLRGLLDTAIGKRAELAHKTTGVRLLNGESDGVPAVVADRFGDAIVVTCYATGFDAIARYVAAYLASAATDKKLRGKEGPGPLTNVERARIVGPAKTVLLRAAHRRIAKLGVVSGIEAGTGKGTGTGTDLDAGLVKGWRPLRGQVGVARFHEDRIDFSVDLAGQKTGTFLDLRALRRAIAAAPLDAARVLNLFAYTGMLGRVAEAAGATSITQVDASETALAFARAHHVSLPACHTFVTADIFEWLPTHQPDRLYDLVIVDPPSMTSKAAQVPKVLAAYKKLYRAAGQLVAPGGSLVAACCTSRITRDAFRATVTSALGADYVPEHDLRPEPDHPVGFPQADYLKITWWRRRATGAGEP